MTTPAAPVSAPAAPAAAPAAPSAPSVTPTISNFAQVMESKNRALMNGPAPANNNATAPPVQSTQAQPAPTGLLGEPPPEAAPDAGGVDPSPAVEPEAPADPNAEPTPESPAMPDVELLAKAREWQANDYLPDEFLGKLVEVEIKLDDGTKRTQLVTAKEMKDGYIRQSALSRAQTRIHHERQQMQARDTNVRQHFERIQDPDTFLQEYENRGYGQVLENVAIRIAERRVAEREHVNAAGIAAMHKYGCDQNDRRVFDAMQRAERQITEAREHALELRRVAAERDQLASQRKREDHDGGVRDLAVSMRKQLDQLRPIAFKAHRIHDNPATQKDFARHLLAQMEVAGSYEVTRDAVMNAARTLSEELEDSRRPAQQAPNGRPPQRPLSPTSQMAGRSVANGASRTRKRASDLMGDLYGKP